MCLFRRRAVATHVANCKRYYNSSEAVFVRGSIEVDFRQLSWGRMMMATRKGGRWGQRQQGAASPQSKSRWGGAREIFKKRAPTPLGREVGLLLQYTSSSFYIDDGNDFYFSRCMGGGGGEGGFVLTHIISYSTCSIGKPQGTYPAHCHSSHCIPQVPFSLPVFISPLVFQ